MIKPLLLSAMIAGILSSVHGIALADMNSAVEAATAEAKQIGTEKATSVINTATDMASAKVQALLGTDNSTAISEEQLQKYRNAANQMLTALKGELQTAMKGGGPIAALEVCQSKAPAIGQQLSQQHGFTMARTSLKVRNDQNAPDAWEKSVLEKFEARKAQGEDPMHIEYAATVEVNGKPAMRYMKAIPTAQLCTICHGSALTAEVSAKIDELYPNDQARGFQAGDLRGAFTFTEMLK